MRRGYAWIDAGGPGCSSDGAGRDACCGLGDGADDDRRQRREGGPGRERQVGSARAGARYALGRRYLETRGACCRGHDPAAEHDRRPAGQSGDPSVRRVRPGCQFGERRAGRREMEERPRQPGLRRRSETEPAEDRRHGRGRQAALGHGDLAEGRHGDCREPRRWQPVGAGDQRQERREGDRHGLGRRTGETRSARSRSRRTASARWRPNPMPTRSRC